LSGKTLTRAGLVEAVIRSVGLPRHEAAELVESVIRELSGALARGEPVKLSSFGSFGIREKSERIGRNPKTGEEVPITPRRVLVFRASNIMKKRIDQSIKKKQGGGASASRSAAGGSGSGASSPPSKGKTARGKKGSAARAGKNASKSAGRGRAKSTGKSSSRAGGGAGGRRASGGSGRRRGGRK
jgi:integration host factor subunit alpha